MSKIDETKVQQMIDRLRETFAEEVEDLKIALSELKAGHVAKAFMITRDTVEAFALGAEEIGQEIGGYTDAELKTAVTRYGDEVLTWEGLPIIIKQAAELVDGSLVGYVYDFVKARLDKTTLDERGIAAAKKILGHVKNAIEIDTTSP